MTNPAMPGTPATPPSRGMPKWLIILLVVLLVIVVGCCGGFGMCTWMCKSAVQTQMQKQGVAIDFSGAGLSLPADFPKDIPIVSGYKVRAKVAPPGGKGGTISLAGTSSLKSVSDYYTAEMPKQGWAQVSATGDADTFSQTYSKETEKRTVMLVGTNNGAELQITYSNQP